MTFNPHYAESLGRELQRDRLRDAERERLIRMVSTPANPPWIVKVLYILRDRWDDIWHRTIRSGKVLSEAHSTKKPARL